MVAAWLLCFILFIFTAAFLTAILLNNSPSSSPSAWQTLLNRIRERLNGDGRHPPKHRYPVELWVWDNSEEDDPCEESLERCTWAPMDIADWMKEGIPQTPESGTEMCEGCRCQLVRYQKSRRPHQP